MKEKHTGSSHSFVDEYYWDTLDNAAKLVPAVSDTRGSNVFRVSAVLCEEVDPELLCEALKRALELFPAFSVRLRRGLFWYYLDANSSEPRVFEERDYPCAPMSGRDRGFLFRVTYYKKRINLEMYHALSDGMGASQLLHVLICWYFCLKDGRIMPEEEIRSYCDLVARDFDEDSFGRIVGASKTSLAKKDEAKAESDAFQLGGYAYDGTRLGVLTLLIPAERLLETAHSYGCTMSEYLSSLIIWSIYNTAYRRAAGRGAKPIVISLPVNLRGMFDSTTMRNFFGHINLSVKPKPGDRLEDVITAVKESFSSCLNREYFERQIAGNVAIERITPIRFVPIWIKDLVMRIIFSRAERKYTITMSNLGRLSLPRAISNKVERMEMLLGGSRTHPKKVSLCSYGNKLAISFSSTIADNSFERFFTKQITGQGIEVEVVSNEVPKRAKSKKAKSKRDDSQRADSHKADSQMADSQMAGSQMVDSRKVDSQRTDSQMTDSQRADSQMVDSQMTDSQRADSHKADSQMANSQMADIQMADSRKADSQRADSQMADIQMADSRKADSQMADNQKVDGQRADSQRADSQMANSQMADSRKADSQRADSQMADNQKVDGSKADSQKVDSQRANSQMTDNQMADSQRNEPTKH